jgi:CubicO group peptidase (beta-lactamase class C family)
LSKFTLTSCLGLLLVLHSYAVFEQKTNNLCPSGTATEDDRFRDIRSLIHQQMKKYELPSVAVSIAQHGHIVWEQGFSYADKETCYWPLQAQCTESLRSPSRSLPRG